MIRSVPPTPKRAAITVLAALIATGSAPRTAAAEGWEYRVERLDLAARRPAVGPPTFVTPADLERRLDEAGAAGWELGESLALPDGSVLLLFKRPAGGGAALRPVPPPAGPVDGAPAPPDRAGSAPGPASGLVDGPTLARRVAEGPSAPGVVDLRPAGAFAAGHVPGSRSLPFAELDRRHRELDPAVPWVLVDAGDGRAAGAANFLRNLGFQAVEVLAGGIASFPGPLASGDR